MTFLLNSNSDAGQTTKNDFTNLPISQILRGSKTPLSPKFATQPWRPQKTRVWGRFAIGPPWLHWAHLSQHSRDAPFAGVPASFPWGGKGTDGAPKIRGSFLTPTQSKPPNLLRKSLQNCVGRFAWSFWFLQDGYLFFFINENGNLSNHLRTLRQKWGSSCSLFSLLSVKILPWQKNTYR